MDKDVIIPSLISERTEYKRKFSIFEMYSAFVKIPNAAFNLIRNKKHQILDDSFIERLQLAVTEVNSCAACSYAHTHMALKIGMSSEEINSFLSGDGNFIKQEEAKAIMFAQHYADTRAFPKIDAYYSLLNEYGKAKVKIIISAIQLMYAGNLYGLPYSALISRKEGKAYKDSSLIYEITMIVGGLILFPISLIDGFLRTIIGLPKIRLDKNTSDN